MGMTITKRLYRVIRPGSEMATPGLDLGCKLGVFVLLDDPAEP